MLASCVRHRLDHDPIRLNRIMISCLCWSMISGQTLRVCPEGKPVPTFPDHALSDGRSDGLFRHYRDEMGAIFRIGMNIGIHVCRIYLDRGNRATIE